jgi:hypothetical protein
MVKLQRFPIIAITVPHFLMQCSTGAQSAPLSCYSQMYISSAVVFFTETPKLETLCFRNASRQILFNYTGYTGYFSLHGNTVDSLSYKLSLPANVYTCTVQLQRPVMSWRHLQKYKAITPSPLPRRPDPKCVHCEVRAMLKGGGAKDSFGFCNLCTEKYIVSRLIEFRRDQRKTLYGVWEKFTW